MPRIIYSIFLFMCGIAAYSQNNVGINTTNPQASLDVRGSQRVGGNSNYISFDSATGRIQWTGAALYVPALQQIIRHSASGEGLYTGNGRLEYHNTTDPVFYSEWSTGNGYFKNNLGINNLTPQFPLSFNGTLGDKISLWTDGTATHYGFGIQAGLLQIFSKTSFDDIAFGYGSSTAFTERMRIKGTGYVGIGNNPGYWLDVNGRIRVRSGGSNGVSAGIWLNNNSNVEASFVGMEDDTHVGLYGNNGAGWKFAMNTQTGALQVNGSDGNSGQVLLSNGAGVAATWGSGTNALYNNTIAISNSTNVTMTSSGPFTQLPGMFSSFSTGSATKVFVSYAVSTWAVGCSFCGASNVYIDIMIDGARQKRSLFTLANGAQQACTDNKTISVGAGSHTVAIWASITGPDVQFNPCCVFESDLTVQLIAQ